MGMGASMTRAELERWAASHSLRRKRDNTPLEAVLCEVKQILGHKGDASALAYAANLIAKFEAGRW